MEIATTNKTCGLKCPGCGKKEAFLVFGREENGFRDKVLSCGCGYIGVREKVPTRVAQKLLDQI